MACCGAVAPTALEQYANSIRGQLHGLELCMDFPMYTVPLRTLMEMTRLEPHEVMKEQGLLVEFDRKMGKAVFVSHQWLDTEHPDPDCRQIRVLQDALRTVKSMRSIPVDVVSETLNHGTPLPSSELLSEPLFFWYDYFSCPQKEERTKSHKRLAINSIPAFVDSCSFFFALVPVLENPDGTNAISPGSWHGRGWCRLERTCRELAQNHDWVVVKGPEDLELISGAVASTRAGAGPVGEGVFTVAKDRLFLGSVLMTALKRKLMSLLDAQDFPGYRAFLNQQPALFRGLECDALAPVPGFEIDLNSPWRAMNFFHQNGFRSISDKDRCGWMPLHYAAVNGDPALVQDLLVLRADPDQGTTGIHPSFGFERGMLPISIACLFRNTDLIQFLISAKAKVTSNVVIHGPLHCAAAQSTRESMRILLEARCSPLEQNSFGGTILQMAAYYGSCEAIDELPRHVNTPLNASEALHSAALGGAGAEVVHRLVEIRADVNIQTDEHFTRKPLMRAVYTLLTLQHRFYKVTPFSKVMYHAKGATPLMVAMLCCNHECAAALISAGAQVNLRNARGCTAADFAVGHSLPEFLREAFEGRVEACRRVSLLARGWVELSF
ncbi:Ankyrin repeat and sterile alpha motif domain-containing protein 1B [Symbiodinium microadriaticum]|uniref:Ankyrin repeat and sterile alpha motif domain-containing protein 1B n=1 Tax=Symbiodinium microadriaticum TaxID=2951 RepID=A0A1Q9C7I2_SYMMI|nr:Ankyrin repeat and sterile alpha motif domain-containing protein 1B [Symbiodinium microadriaticum]CAE7882928.1 anks1b [Symbiodinium microadriaticum]CAE7943132.1 anks1b [Symbiodinium sp. KB8]